MTRRPSWEPVTELSPRQVRTRAILRVGIAVMVFVIILAGIGLWGVVS